MEVLSPHFMLLSCSWNNVHSCLYVDYANKVFDVYTIFQETSNYILSMMV